MTDKSDPAINFFREFETLYSIIASEIVDLTDEQLDYTSDNWEWAGWSIRNQVSHMSLLILRWLVSRWGSTIFPLGDHGVANIEKLSQSKSDGRLDDDIGAPLARDGANLEPNCLFTEGFLQEVYA